MPLKNYKFTRINEFGDAETNDVSVRVFNSDYENGIVEIYLRSFKSKEARTDGSQPRSDLRLRIEGAAFLVAAMSPITEAETGQPFLFIFSDRIWAIAFSAAFVEDYSEVDADGKRIMTLKSLRDLEAIVSE